MQMGNPRVRHGRMLISALLCAALSLSGCGGGDGSAVANSTPADSNTTTQPTQPTQPAQPAAVNWTTLGTRATPAQPGTSITGNAGAKWADYNPPALYAGVAKQATQYITMPDGTKLAAYVTLPADASGKAATGTFPEADVWISSTALDAGVSVRIDDVDAAGNVTPHTDGLQTASLRAVDGSRSGPSSFRVEHNTHNDSWSSSPVGMCAGRWSACAHVHRAGLSRRMSPWALP